MSNIDTIRALKDEAYRSGLEKDQIPANPAGLIEIEDDQLDAVAGGLPKSPRILWTGYCCA